MQKPGNIAEIYNQKAREAYLRALICILGNQEEQTGLELNNARDALLDGKHGSEFCDEDVKRILPHLTVEKFYRLYGDYGSTSQNRWIRDPELVAMVLNDLQHLSPLCREESPKARATANREDGPAVRLVG